MSGAYHLAYDKVLPNALQVADPFHVIKLANQRLDEVRRRTQNDTLGHRGRKGDPLYRIRRVLTSASERISDRGRTRLRGLLDAGDPHGEVRTAWHATETVRAIYDIDSPALALQHTHQARRRPPQTNPAHPRSTNWAEPSAAGPPRSPTGTSPEATNRCHRSPQQPHQENQESSVRITQLRQLPNTGTPLRRLTQLGPTRHGHSPLKSEEPYNLR